MLQFNSLVRRSRLFILSDVLSDLSLGTSISLISTVTAADPRLIVGNVSFLVDNHSPTIIPSPATLGSNSNPGAIVWTSQALTGENSHKLNISRSNGNLHPSYLYTTLNIQSFLISNGTIPASETASANPTVTADPAPKTTVTADPASKPLSPDTVMASTRSHRTHQIIGGAFAAVVVILYIAAALALRRRRANRLHLEQQLQPAIQPFSLHPFSVFRRGILHTSDRVLKGRLVPESALTPSKRRNIEDTASLVNPQAIIIGPRSPPPREPSADPSIPLSAIAHVREQDSGLRMVEDGNEEVNMVVVLPPEYTAA